MYTHIVQCVQLLNFILIKCSGNCTSRPTHIYTHTLGKSDEKTCSLQNFPYHRYLTWKNHMKKKIIKTAETNSYASNFCHFLTFPFIFLVLYVCHRVKSSSFPPQKCVYNNGTLLTQK